MLSPRHWVVFTDKSNLESEEDHHQHAVSLVGLILETGPSKEAALHVNVFTHLTKALMQQLRILLNCDPLCKWIPQILRTKKSKWIASKSVQSIAWVFSQVCIDSRPDEGHQGMDNLFMLGYDDTGAQIVCGCHPFCSGYPRFAMHLADCYQERVWNGIQTLRAEICQHLGRYSEKQGMFARDSSNIVMGKVRDFVRPPHYTIGTKHQTCPQSWDGVVVITSFGSVVGMPPIVTAVVHWPKNM